MACFKRAHKSGRDRDRDRDRDPQPQHKDRDRDRAKPAKTTRAPNRRRAYPPPRRYLPSRTCSHRHSSSSSSSSSSSYDDEDSDEDDWSEEEDEDDGEGEEDEDDEELSAEECQAVLDMLEQLEKEDARQHRRSGGQGKRRKNNTVQLLLVEPSRDGDDEGDWIDMDEDEDEDDEDEDEEASVTEDEDVPPSCSSRSSASTWTDADESKLSASPGWQQLKALAAQHPDDRALATMLREYRRNWSTLRQRDARREKKQRAKYLRIFRRLVQDKGALGEMAYYQTLPLEKQKAYIKDVRAINRLTRHEKPYRMLLLDADIPVEHKAAAYRKFSSLKGMTDVGGDSYQKLKQWGDNFLKLPFNKWVSLPVNLAEHGQGACLSFLSQARKQLDQAVYGMSDAKSQTLQMLGQLLANPKAVGQTIAIHGPPGTGKTSLVKEGIAKILGRPTAFVALGGASDGSFLEGHGFAYEGSMCGKIAQILIDCQCMNPVIFFDELDKVSNTPKGDEIVGILTHLTDTTQNTHFHDKYFAEIDLDVSKCMFVFSYNDESRINPILRDRMYRIRTQGYSGKDKTTIARQYLLPKIREQVGFDEAHIVVDDAVLQYIHEHHCEREDGVRNLKRCLETIHAKLNLYRFLAPGDSPSTLFGPNPDMALLTQPVSFPFKVTRDAVDQLLKTKVPENPSALLSMYC